MAEARWRSLFEQAPGFVALLAMKAKGVGELGICGVAATVANAVDNATGVRVRNYPITLDKLLDKLPDNR